ncbi:hypothetical protein HY945_05525 [Candidatus Gottesmanbacteria bacterium]|nr:hypothetical protein [Candidatus Gottesmanbacteria bacterium]
MKTFIKGALFVLVCFALFIVLEVFSHLILPNGKLGTLESIFNITEEDPVLFWRQRAHLKTEFQGVKVMTNSLGLRNKEISIAKPKGIFRVICLGASPTFGWGVSVDKTYPFLLEQRLKEAKQRFEDIEVINAGQIGYSSHQGLIFFEQYMMKYSPDLIVVSYVLNDIDRYRFFRNEGVMDKELKTSRFSAITIRLKRLLTGSRLYLVLNRAVSDLLYKNNRSMSLVLKKQVELAKVRVSQDCYKDNLEKFITLCSNSGVKLIFVKMPINLSLPSGLSDSKTFQEGLYGLSRLHYTLGCQYLDKKDYVSSFEFFKKAKDYLVFECQRDGKVYQDLMEAVAIKNNVPLVDAAKVFSENARYGELFNGKLDPTHPNPAGQRLIAESVYEIILRYDLLKS